jgi:hypothetical protein
MRVRSPPSEHLLDHSLSFSPSPGVSLLLCVRALSDGRHLPGALLLPRWPPRAASFFMIIA